MGEPWELEVDKPRVIVADYSGDIVDIDERRLKAVFGDCFVSIKRGKRYRVSVVCLEGGEPKHVVSGVEVAPGEADYLNIDHDMVERIKFYMYNWDLILERREAEIYLRARIKVAPRNVTDRELLAESAAKTILNDRVVRTFYVNKGGRNVELGVYCYDGGYYRECEDELRGAIERYVSGRPLQEVKVTKWVVGEALEKIKRRTQALWEPARHKLLFKDRVFDWDRFVETGDFRSSLLEPSPELYVEHRIPWGINLEAWDRVRVSFGGPIPPSSADHVIEIFRVLAPKSFEAFLSWVRGEGESEAKALPKVALLLEIIGYTLYPHDYPYNKAVLLVGEGRNGKSTYLRLLRTILGEQNVVSVNMKDLDTRHNRFAAAELFGKLANISAEPVKGTTIDVTLFKQLTGEDMVMMERKNRDPFFTVNYAKVIFSANELPQVTEDTHAFWRRWLVVKFPNQFPIDHEFFQRTFTPEEIEGVILCALHAFRLVLLRRGFTEAGTEDPKEEWLRRSNPVYRVVKRMLDDGIIELRGDGWVVKKDLYELYKAYVNKLNNEEDEDLTPVSKKKFTEELETLFPIKSGEERINKHVKTYRGVAIKNWEEAEKLVSGFETPRSGQKEQNGGSGDLMKWVG